MGMFDWLGRRARPERAILASLSRCQAVVECGPDGIIRSANDLFLALLGCRAEAVLGQPHARFVHHDDEERLWRALGRGEPVTGCFHAVGPGGAEAWLQASYIPVADGRGGIAGVHLHAVDVTAEYRRSLDVSRAVTDAGRGQGVAEFSLEGELLAANEAFVALLGYRLDEALGRHHDLFAEGADDGEAFWRRLHAGLHDAGVYRRRRKDGGVVWMQATYNPVFDAQGRPAKIVVYAVHASTDAPHERIDPLAHALDGVDRAELLDDTWAMDAAIEAEFARRDGQAAPGQSSAVPSGAATASNGRLSAAIPRAAAAIAPTIINPAPSA